MQPVVPGKPPAAAAQASNVLVGPLKGAAGSRDNRDMSEGLEKSRSHKLGALVQMPDLGQADTQSQQDFFAIKKKSQSNTIDSNGLPTASNGATKISSNDMSRDATDQANNLSHSDIGARLKPVSTIPKTQIKLQSDQKSNPNSSRRHLSVRKQSTFSPRESSYKLNLDKKFELTIHQVKMQISSRIDLQLFC